MDRRDGPPRIIYAESCSRACRTLGVLFWLNLMSVTRIYYGNPCCGIHSAKPLQNPLKKCVIKPGIILFVARQGRRDSPSEIFLSSSGSSPGNNSWKGRVNLGRTTSHVSEQESFAKSGVHVAFVLISSRHHVLWMHSMNCKCFAPICLRNLEEHSQD